MTETVTDDGAWVCHEGGDRVGIDALKTPGGNAYAVEAECNYRCEVRTDQGRDDGSHDIRDLVVDPISIDVFVGDDEAELRFDDLPEADRREIEAAVEKEIAVKLGEQLYVQWVFERGPFERTRA